MAAIPRTDATRLDANAWTEAALELLARGGIEGVRVELLAKRLGVTKGSFYWHFKDRKALYASMLAHWRRRATIALIERLDKGERDPHERLRLLLRLPIVGERSAIGADIELAIRLWGRSDDAARMALQEVDELRLRYIAQLMKEGGVPAQQAEPRAVLAYSYLRVAATLIPKSATALMKQCENLLLGPSRAS